MRVAWFQAEAGLAQRLKDALVQDGVFLDIVTGAPGKSVAKMIRGSPPVLLAAEGAWILPVVEYAIDNKIPVLVAPRDLGEWYTLEIAGLVRQVDLYVFDGADLFNKVNRNVNHVVIEDDVDIHLLAGVAANLVRYFQPRQPLTEARAAREQTTAAANAICKLAHPNDVVSFPELQFFVDGMHVPREREVLIPNLNVFIERGMPVREIRGLVLPPKKREAPNVS